MDLTLVNTVSQQQNQIISLDLYFTFIDSTTLQSLYYVSLFLYKYYFVKLKPNF